MPFRGLHDPALGIGDVHLEHFRRFLFYRFNALRLAAALLLSRGLFLDDAVLYLLLLLPDFLLFFLPKAFLDLPQLAKPPLPGGQVRRQFVPSPAGAVQLVFTGVRVVRLTEVVPYLFPEPRLVPVGGQGRVRTDLRPVKGDRVESAQTRLAAQGDYLEKEG
ncbi:hypothetical protein SDC9_144887 [bioreactor metagenome]|uniref:Uncharacterized protein n=1 Tax=bioreactor metagenome TaxID=1076179 RepID=A0A645E7J2_9ZZZZ